MFSLFATVKPSSTTSWTVNDYTRFTFFWSLGTFKDLLNILKNDRELERDNYLVGAKRENKTAINV